MRFTQIDESSRTPQVVWCRGTHHEDDADAGHCGDCGALVARVKKPGKPKYLANTHHKGMALTYWCWDVHKCDPEQRERYTALVDSRLASGVIMKGQHVEVVRGRKVPIGTVGTVMWMGTDAWDNEKVGLRVDGYDKLVYTAKKNVEAR
jgi:hypothetical protein